MGQKMGLIILLPKKMKSGEFRLTFFINGVIVRFQHEQNSRNGVVFVVISVSRDAGARLIESGENGTEWGAGKRRLLLGFIVARRQRSTLTCWHCFLF